jgi:ribosome recycling factor
MTDLTDTKSILQVAQQKMMKTVDATKREFKNIRTGRASIALVEGIVVDYYNTPTPLKGLANISTPDAKSIAITPWDASAIVEIEKAIMKSDLGLNPSNDGKVVRINIPALTSERREELTKVIKKTAEEGRVAVRAARHEAIEAVKKLEKGKLVPEDVSHASQKDIQKITDKFIGEVEEALKHKEVEIHTI